VGEPVSGEPRELAVAARELEIAVPFLQVFWPRRGGGGRGGLRRSASSQKPLHSRALATGGDHKICAQRPARPHKRVETHTAFGDSLAAMRCQCRRHAAVSCARCVLCLLCLLCVRRLWALCVACWVFLAACCVFCALCARAHVCVRMCRAQCAGVPVCCACACVCVLCVARVCAVCCARVCARRCARAGGRGSASPPCPSHQLPNAKRLPVKTLQLHLLGS
jgi:hypothetical protein